MKTVLQTAKKAGRIRQYNQGLTHVVSCRVTPSDLLCLQHNGTVLGQSLGQQLRDAWLSKPPAVAVPEVNREAFAALSRMGSSLNQYVRLANSGAVPCPDFDPALLLHVMRDLKTALLGGK